MIRYLSNLPVFKRVISSIVKKLKISNITFNYENIIFKLDLRYLVDRRFIQGLIQLSVSCVHMENGNIKGAKSLLNKSIEKFVEFKGVHRGIDVNNLLDQINRVSDAYENLISGDSFDWKIIPRI